VEARWHQWSEEHILGRVTWDEVTEALAPPIVTRPSRDVTLKVLGQTLSGRYLAVLVAPDKDAPTVFVITAREMNDWERTFYRGRLSKG
jgi:hypothetical protein